MSKSEQALLNEVPFCGTGTPMPPTDPLIYRFYELIMVNGPALKALIEEEFGDGIMSAIDFDMDITRKADPKGDGVSLGMTGIWVEGGVGRTLRHSRSSVVSLIGE
jgi:cyanate lyase